MERALKSTLLANFNYTIKYFTESNYMRVLYFTHTYTHTLWFTFIDVIMLTDTLLHYIKGEMHLFYIMSVYSFISSLT